MKTVDRRARLAIAVARRITVSTLAEASISPATGSPISYAVGITPQKLDQVAKLNNVGASVIVLTEISTPRARSPYRRHALTTTGRAVAGWPGRRPVPETAERLVISPAPRRMPAIPRRRNPTWRGSQRRAGRRGARGRRPREADTPAHVRRAAPTGCTAAICGVRGRAGAGTVRHPFQAEIGTRKTRPDRADGARQRIVSGGAAAGRRRRAGALKDRSTVDAPKDYGFGLRRPAGTRSHGDTSCAAPTRSTAVRPIQRVR